MESEEKEIVVRDQNLVIKVGRCFDFLGEEGVPWELATEVLGQKSNGIEVH